jgi:hypothetical protein
VRLLLQRGGHGRARSRRLRCWPAVALLAPTTSSKPGLS